MRGHAEARGPAWARVPTVSGQSGSHITAVAAYSGCWCAAAHARSLAMAHALALLRKSTSMLAQSGSLVQAQCTKFQGSHNSELALGRALLIAAARLQALLAGRSSLLAALPAIVCKMQQGRNFAQFAVCKPTAHPPLLRRCPTQVHLSLPTHGGSHTVTDPLILGHLTWEADVNRRSRDHVKLIDRRRHLMPLSVLLSLIFTALAQLNLVFAARRASRPVRAPEALLPCCLPSCQLCQCALSADIAAYLSQGRLALTAMPLCRDCAAACAFSYATLRGMNECKLFREGTQYMHFSAARTATHVGQPLQHQTP